jgi:RNA polymerase sigma-70 factor (ECF subfamily)
VSDTDHVLVARSQQGDRAAFEELVRRTARLVYARAYLDTGNVHRAEDLTQETYLIAWRSIRQVSNAAGLRTWLLQITHTAAIDAARTSNRKKRTGPFGGDASGMLHLADSAPTPGESAECAEEREQALAALRQLPEEYRQVLMLRYLAGADYETIAQQLALSNGSLRGLLHRGLALLRSRLSPNESRRV